MHAGGAEDDGQGEGAAAAGEGAAESEGLSSAEGDAAGEKTAAGAVAQELPDKQGRVKVLISVPKRNHKRAVVRNLLKRRTREAYRLNKAPLLAAFDATSDMRGANKENGRELHLGLIYASKKAEEYPVIEEAVRKIISKLADQCKTPSI